MYIKKQNLRKNQDGVVSIIVTIMIILLITLIVLALAQNSNREQRQSLDRQLSNQAYYNAESGINDTVNMLRKYPAAAAEKTDCGQLQPPDGSPPYDNKLSPGGNNQYSCITYDKDPATLAYQDVNSSSAVVIPIQTENAGGIARLQISWEEKDGNNFSGCADNADGSSQLPQSLDINCKAGLLKTSIIASQSGLSRANLANNSSTAFIVPTRAAAQPPIPYYAGYTNSGGIFAGNCSSSNVPMKCKAELELNLAPNVFVFLTLKSIYKNSNVVVSAVNDAGEAVELKNAQVLIDSTGKSADVLRRVQVRVPARTPYAASDYALQTTDSICKLYDVYPENPGTATPNWVAEDMCTP